MFLDYNKRIYCKYINIINELLPLLAFINAQSEDDDRPQEEAWHDCLRKVRPTHASCRSGTTKAKEEDKDRMTSGCHRRTDEEDKDAGRRSPSADDD